MKNPSSLNFLLFTCFLVIGFSVSSSFNHSDYSGSLNSTSLIARWSSDSVQSLNNGQRSILLIGVDSYNTSHPELTSLWLVTYMPADPTINLLPILPSGSKINSDHRNQLYYSFNLIRKNGDLVLNQGFIDMLAENNYWWSGYIIYDHVALADLVNQLGMVEIDGGIISAEQAISKLPDAMDASPNSFSYQLAIIQTACQNLTGIPQKPVWSQDISLSPTHILTDLDIQGLMTEWEATFSSKHSLNCRFPTLEVSRIDN